MTKTEFKELWESNDDGGGITFDDIAECAKDWGLCATPRTKPMHEVRYMVLKAAETSDAEMFASCDEPEELDDVDPGYDGILGEG